MIITNFLVRFVFAAEYELYGTTATTRLLNGARAKLVPIGAPLKSLNDPEDAVTVIESAVSLTYRRRLVEKAVLPEALCRSFPEAACQPLRL